MPRLTIAFGVVLIALGLVAYFVLPGMFPGTEENPTTQSPTALIPAGFGLFLVIFGAVAMNPARRKHAMHAAAGLTLVGFLGTAKSFLSVPTLFSDAYSLERPVATGVQAVMGVLSIVFIILCVRSFMAARRS